MMMIFILFNLLLLILALTSPVGGESPTCLAVYREGGATAVFQSPKCPRWNLSNFKSQSNRRLESRSMTCQSATLQGRRKSQEDRTLCAVDLRIPFPGPKGVKEVNVGIMAVFDGHNGSEASEMASELLLEYFVLHTYFLLDTTYAFLSRNLMKRLPDKMEDAAGFQKIQYEDIDGRTLNIGRFKVTLSTILDGSLPFDLLREALLRAIHDIDAKFTMDAARYNLSSGTTAAVVLLAEAQILVANLGDSKAFLCSEVYQSPPENKVLIAKELTNDHHPDNEVEKSRVESAGGNISKWAGVARVNGQLAVTRAIGDIHFKNFGVISVPEVTDWKPLSGNESYIIAASDGVFEKLSPQDICDILWEPLAGFTIREKLNSTCSTSLADCIVNAAFEQGSMDNLAALVINMREAGSIATFGGKIYREPDYLGVVDERKIYVNSADANTSILAELRPLPDVTKFDRLLVEGKHNNFRCFYLSENLDVNDDYTFWIHKDGREPVSEQLTALSGAHQFTWSRPIDFYSDQHTCMHFGSYIDDEKDHCMSSDGFARFLGFLGSIPLHNSGQNEHATSDTRYILKKKFDRGAYGEVWLAFNWNCSQVGKNSQRKFVEENGFYSNERSTVHNENEDTNMFFEDCKRGNSDDNMFILKRIMVERGIGAYLSGLREKYFGEIFLNASNSLQGSSPPREPDFWKLSHCSTHGSGNVNKSVNRDTEDSSIPEDVNFREKRLGETAYEEGLNHIARYVESFESRSNEIWLVFHHEGFSLSKLLYTAEDVVSDADKERGNHGKRIQILRASKWWHWLKTTETGQEEFRDIIWQLLMALKSCHDRNITHRDIKPENMVICFEDPDSGSCLTSTPNSSENYTTKMRIIDFGSAVNDFTVKHFYGSLGPSSNEQTSGYAPPEAFLNVSWYKGPSTVTSKYDMWSVGVVIMEMILGSPNVFQINSKTQALLDQQLKGWNDNLKELAYKLRSLMEMCILIPGISSKLHQNGGTNSQSSSSPVPWKCSEEYFSYLIRSRDPLQLGFPNIWALRLVRGLLEWDPESRLSVDDALRHPYFTSAS
ncbi:uncharacterized protein LOC125200884 isoform X2 [Salvia hispanica]|uniref:uncharacterized protein LOC125200884 isoform X2 n=1 Tax=Salvia hispanica TaxID=49212 RepID=UPI0020092099|nr:uncharacterized protein LOC125200884 isoform X2 [Salvia hispanica]